MQVGSTIIIKSGKQEESGRRNARDLCSAPFLLAQPFSEWGMWLSCSHVAFDLLKTYLLFFSLHSDQWLRHQFMLFWHVSGLFEHVFKPVTHMHEIARYLELIMAVGRRWAFNNNRHTHKKPKKKEGTK